MGDGKKWEGGRECTDPVAGTQCVAVITGWYDWEVRSEGPAKALEWGWGWAVADCTARAAPCLSKCSGRRP